MQVGFMMQKALGELFILKSTKPLPIIFNTKRCMLSEDKLHCISFVHDNIKFVL